MTPSFKNRTSATAMTLIEVLVTAAIICIIAALMFPALGHVNESKKKTKCLSNLRQIGQGVLLYAADHDGALPAVYDGSAPDGDMYWYNSVCRSLSMDTWAAWEVNGIFRCPSCPKVPSYTMSWSLVRDGEPMRLSQVNRASTSVVAADGFGYEGAGINASSPFGGLDAIRHSGGANYVFLDGHVEFLKKVPEDGLDSNYDE